MATTRKCKRRSFIFLRWLLGPVSCPLFMQWTIIAVLLFNGLSYIFSLHWVVLCYACAWIYREYMFCWEISLFCNTDLQIVFLGTILLCCICGKIILNRNVSLVGSKPQKCFFVVENQVLNGWYKNSRKPVFTLDHFFLFLSWW